MTFRRGEHKWVRTSARPVKREATSFWRKRERRGLGMADHSARGGRGKMSRKDAQGRCIGRGQVLKKSSAQKKGKRNWAPEETENQEFER